MFRSLHTPGRPYSAEATIPRTVAAGLAIAVAGAIGLVAVHPAGATTASPSVLRLAAARSSLKDSDGHRWTADAAYASGGHRIVRQVSSRHAALAAERVGRVRYRIPVTAGKYTITVTTAENHRPRVFTVVAEGHTMNVTHATTGRVGKLQVFTSRFTTSVTDGFLDVTLGSNTRPAAVSTVQLVRTATLPVPAASTARTPARRVPAPVTTPSRSPSPSPAPSSSSSPAPSPAPSSSSSSAPPSSSANPLGTVTPEQFGAVGNGRTDDQSALQNTFDNANGRTVVLAAGRTYAHSGVLHLHVAGLHVTGGGTLLATNEQYSDVWIDADNITLDGSLTVTIASTTRRWDSWDQMAVRLEAHSGDVVRDLTVNGSAAAGIYVGGAYNFVLDHVTVENTRADGIHMTRGSHNGSVISPTISNTGDDGVAVVSYSQDGTPCHDITVTSPRVLSTSWGRGLSVVGGENITETNISVANTSAAGVYIAAEGSPFYTAAPKNVLISGGTITHANETASVEHGAVLVMSGESGVVPTGVTVQNLTIVNTASTKRDLGVITYGSLPSHVLFSNINISGGPAQAYEGNTAQSGYSLRNIVQNGVRLPDAG